LGRSQSSSKTILLATRVTPMINELIKQMAYREGLHVSEWIRNVITNELKNNDLLSTGLREPVLKNRQKTGFPIDARTRAS
jgi:hypothetical protein